MWLGEARILDPPNIQLDSPYRHSQSSPQSQRGVLPKVEGERTGGDLSVNVYRSGRREPRAGGMERMFVPLLMHEKGREIRGLFQVYEFGKGEGD